MRYLLIVLMSIISASGCFGQTVENESKAFEHFAWGVDVSGSIDMTGEGMSSVNFDGVFGYKNSFFRLLGVGAAVNMVMNSCNRSFPIFAIVRTSFRNRPSLCFLDLRGGISVNDVYGYKKQTGGYGSVGLGITLATGKTFSSHLILGYSFIERTDFEHDGEKFDCRDLHSATLGIGISF